MEVGRENEGAKKRDFNFDGQYLGQIFLKSGGDPVYILPGTDTSCWCWPWSSCRRPPPWKPPQGCAASPRRRRWCIPTLSDLSWSCLSKGICFQSSRFEILGSPSSVSSALDPCISIWKMNSEHIANKDVEQNLRIKDQITWLSCCTRQSPLLPKWFQFLGCTQECLDQHSMSLKRICLTNYFLSNVNNWSPFAHNGHESSWGNWPFSSQVASNSVKLKSSVRLILGEHSYRKKDLDKDISEIQCWYSIPS